MQLSTSKSARKPVPGASSINRSVPKTPYSVQRDDALRPGENIGTGINTSPTEHHELEEPRFNDVQAATGEITGKGLNTNAEDGNRDLSELMTSQRNMSEARTKKTGVDGPDDALDQLMKQSLAKSQSLPGYNLATSTSQQRIKVTDKFALTGLYGDTTPQTGIEHQYQTHDYIRDAKNYSKPVDLVRFKPKIPIKVKNKQQEVNKNFIIKGDAQQIPLKKQLESKSSVNSAIKKKVQNVYINLGSTQERDNYDGATTRTQGTVQRPSEPADLTNQNDFQRTLLESRFNTTYQRPQKDLRIARTAQRSSNRRNNFKNLTGEGSSQDNVQETTKSSELLQIFPKDSLIQSNRQMNQMPTGDNSKSLVRVFEDHQLFESQQQKPLQSLDKGHKLVMFNAQSRRNIYGLLPGSMYTSNNSFYGNTLIQPLTGQKCKMQTKQSLIKEGMASFLAPKTNRNARTAEQRTRKRADLVYNPDESYYQESLSNQALNIQSNINQKFDQEHQSHPMVDFVGIYSDDLPRGHIISPMQLESSDHGLGPAGMFESTMNSNQSKFKSRNHTLSEMKKKNFLRNNTQNLKLKNLTTSQPTGMASSLSKQQFERHLSNKFLLMNNISKGSPRLAKLISKAKTNRIPLKFSHQQEKHHQTSTQAKSRSKSNSKEGNKSSVKSPDTVGGPKLKRMFNSQSIETGKLRQIKPNQANADGQARKAGKLKLRKQDPDRQIATKFSRFRSQRLLSQTVKKDSPVKMFKDRISRLSKEDDQAQSVEKPAVESESQSQSNSEDRDEDLAKLDPGAYEMNQGSFDERKSEYSDVNYEELLTNLQNKQASSGGSSSPNLISDHTSKMCQKKNFQVQGLELILNRKLEKEFIRMCGIDPAAHCASVRQHADCLHNVGKIKNQINSTIFYLQNSIVADSDSKYHVFNYEAPGNHSHKELLATQQIYGTGMVQALDVVEGKVPVFCKVSLPPKNPKCKVHHKVYELQFKLRELSSLIKQQQAKKPKSSKESVQPSARQDEAVGQAKTARPGYTSARAPQKMQNTGNYLDDVTVYLSSMNKEPNESSYEMKVTNQRSFLFRCGHPPTGFIYFTLVSKDGCKLRVSLEYLSSCDPNKQNQQKSKLEASGRQKYQRFNISAESRPVDFDLLEELYPAGKNEYRSPQDLEQLMVHMMKELTNYQQEEMKKSYGRVKDDCSQVHLQSFIKVNTMKQGKQSKPHVLDKMFTKIYQRDQRLIQAQDKRELINQQRRNELNYERIKWDVERIQREKAKDVFIKLFRRQKRVLHLMTLFEIKKIFLRARHNLTILQQKQRRMMMMHAIERAFFLKFWLRHKTKYSRDQRRRFTNHIRRQFTLVAGVMYSQPLGISKFQNKSTGDPAIERRMPRLPDTYSDSILSIRAKKVLHAFLKESAKVLEFADKLKRAGSMQRLKVIFHAIFQQIRYRKRLIFARISKEIPFLIQMFKAYGGKRELNIVSLLEKIDSEKLNDFVKLYIKMKAFEYRSSRNKELLPIMASEVVVLENKIQDKQRKIKQREAVALAKDTKAVLDIIAMKSNNRELIARMQKKKKDAKVFNKQIQVFKMKTMVLSTQIFGGTEIVDEYVTDERSAEFDQFEEIEDPYDKQFQIKQYFDKISKQTPQKTPRPKSKPQNKKIKLTGGIDGGAEAIMQQKLLMEKFQMMAGSECSENDCIQEKIENVAFVIKLDKEELHRIIFKAIIHENELSHAYVYNKTSVIQAAQAQKEKEEKPEKPQKEGKSPKKRR